MRDGELAGKPIDVVEVPVGSGFSMSVVSLRPRHSLVLVLLVQLGLVELAVVERPGNLGAGSRLSNRGLLGSPRMGAVLARLGREILALGSVLITITIDRDRQPANAGRADPFSFSSDHITHVVQVRNVLVSGDAGVCSRLTNRGKLRAHHGAGERAGREGRHVANAVSFGERAKRRGRGVTQEGANSRESEKRVDLHGVFGGQRRRY